VVLRILRRLLVPSVVVLGLVAVLEAAFLAQDPGVRGDAPGAGDPIDGLSPAEAAVFAAGQESFEEVNSVKGTLPETEAGLGPRFNLDSCAGCHTQPAIGGSSPFVNPQVAMARKAGATNTVPFFVKRDGPVREARFKYKPDGSRDGGVQALFTITGRVDAPGCVLSQPDFDGAAAAGNLIFRTPTPVFGAGLIEAIDDTTILANQFAQGAAKRALGISGRPNRNGNDGTIARFGWKAQNKSLVLFSGEAYNVEQGVTNEVFPHERDETAGCLFNRTPESEPDFQATTAAEALSDVVKFATFMRFLAPPEPAPDTPSVVRGRATFVAVGCALCHTPSLPTGNVTSAVLAGRRANLFSDLLLHQMGPGLADDIVQGAAGPDEFRTAPLWGLGQRIFFLHDGRTRDLVEAIRAHASAGNARFGPSEANRVIGLFNGLSESSKQDLLNFLRSL
jgi:CxxC motif-containing protein (DUF1111 family)